MGNSIHWHKHGRQRQARSRWRLDQPRAHAWLRARRHARRRAARNTTQLSGRGRALKRAVDAERDAARIVSAQLSEAASLSARSLLAVPYYRVRRRTIRRDRLTAHIVLLRAEQRTAARLARHAAMPLLRARCTTHSISIIGFMCGKLDADRLTLHSSQDKQLEQHDPPIGRVVDCAALLLSTKSGLQRRRLRCA